MSVSPFMSPRICNDEYRRLSIPSVSRAATAVAIFRHDAGGSLMLSRYENTARFVLRLNTETAISPVSSLRGECRNLFISSFRLLSKAICCAVGLGSSGVFLIVLVGGAGTFFVQAFPASFIKYVNR